MRSRFLRLLAPLVVVAGVLAALAPAGTAAAPGDPAPVKITFRDDLTGRVISDRAACVSGRTVFGFARQGSAGRVEGFGSTTTDARGRYGDDVRSAGVGDNTRFFTLVLGDRRCRLAQSSAIRPPRMQAAGLPKRTISFRASTARGFGRVVSPRPACVRRVPVGLFVREPGQRFTFVRSTLTDRDGRYDFGEGRRLGDGGRTDLVTVAFGTDGVCRVAQSPTRSVDPAPLP